MSGSDGSTIRLARPLDMPRIREIDLLATRKFATIPALADLSTSAEAEGGVDEDTVKKWMTEGHVYVAETAHAGDKRVIGFVAFHPLVRTSGATYLAELGVVPEYQGRGIGTRLVKAVLNAPLHYSGKQGNAREVISRRVMLMTYADVPWNGPWYVHKFGFREVAEHEVEGECGQEVYSIFTEDRAKLECEGWRRCLLLWEDLAQEQ